MASRAMSVALSRAAKVQACGPSVLLVRGLSASSSKAREDSWLRSLFVRKVDPRKDAHSNLLAKRETSNLYKIQFHNVKPECLDTYNKLCEDVLSKVHAGEDYPCTLVGSWNTWYGEQDQAVHLWRYEGGYPALTEVMSKLRKNKVVPNYKILFPGKNDNVPMVIRNAAWANILNKVNAVGICKRTVPELKKKWSDLKKKVKAKLATIGRYARQTGGGPSCPVKLSQFEEKVGSICCREQIEGFGEADVCMQAISAYPSQSQEASAQNDDEELVQEGEEHAHSEAVMAQEDIGVAQENVHGPREELWLPSDLGLSANQTTYINEYTRQHLQFMNRVDQQFGDLQQGLSKLADAYLTGSNNILQGLNQIANIIQEKNNKPQTNVASSQTNSPLTNINRPNPAPENVDTHGILVSQSPQISHLSATSISSVMSNATPRNNSVETIAEDDDSPLAQPIDLTVTLPKLPSMPNTTDLQVSKFGHLSTSAQFLISCKTELAMEDVAGTSDSVAPDSLHSQTNFAPGHQAYKKTQPHPRKKAKK